MKDLVTTTKGKATLIIIASLTTITQFHNAPPNWNPVMSGFLYRAGLLTTLHIIFRDEVLEACRLQRSRFEVARGRRHRAREAADLLLIALYTHIPPSRGLEMRTLEILHAETLPVPFTASDYPERNVALLKESGAVTIHIQLYKTRKFSGHDQVELEVSCVNSTV